jgi:hypothetical protein
MYTSNLLSFLGESSSHQPNTATIHFSKLMKKKEEVEEESISSHTKASLNAFPQTAN